MGANMARRLKDCGYAVTALYDVRPEVVKELAAELGSAAMVADQDTENLKRIQRGIRASKKPGATMSVYQESRIRHFHKTLEAYMAKG